MAFTSIDITAPQETALGDFVNFSVTVHRNSQGEMTVGQIKTIIMLNDKVQPPNQWTYDVEYYSHIPINSSRTYTGGFLMRGTQVRIVVWTYYWWYGDSSYHKDAEKVAFIEVGTTPPPPTGEWILVAQESLSAKEGGAGGWLTVAQAGIITVKAGEPTEPSAIPWTAIGIGGAVVLAVILLIPKGKNGGQPVQIFMPQQPYALPPGRG